MFHLSFFSYLKEMYIFIDKRCLFKPFSYETWICFWTMYFKNLIVSPNRKKYSPVDPPPSFYCLHQRLVLPLNKTFYVINQKNVSFSCSHCSCTIFMLPSYSLHTQAVPVLILINVQYLQIAVFSFEKDLNGQKYS